MLYNAIDMMLDYRPSNTVIVISLTEDGWFLLDEGDFFPTKNPSSLGLGSEDRKSTRLKSSHI